MAPSLCGKSLTARDVEFQRSREFVLWKYHPLKLPSNAIEEINFTIKAHIGKNFKLNTQNYTNKYEQKESFIKT